MKNTNVKYRIKDNGDESMQIRCSTCGKWYQASSDETDDILCSDSVTWDEVLLDNFEGHIELISGCPTCNHRANAVSRACVQDMNNQDEIIKDMKYIKGF